MKSWMPTRLNYGEGHADREETDKHLFRSAGVVSMACQEGDLGNWGRPGTDGGSHLQRRLQGRRSVRETERVLVPRKPGNAGGGKGPYFWCAWKKERIGDWR